MSNRSSFGERVLTAAIVLAAFCAPASCGFDGRATLERSSSSPDSGDPSRSDAGARETGMAACGDQVLSFDGVDDVATVPDDGPLDLPSDFTVEAWIKPTSKAAGSVAMEVVSHHDDVRGWTLRVLSGRVEIGVAGVEGFTTKSYRAGEVGGAYVQPGVWAHVAGTLEGKTLRIYYGGILRDTQELGRIFFRAPFKGPVRLGRAAVDAAHYQGELDDVRLSNVARYTGSSAPKPTSALATDDQTVASWRFDEQSGSTIVDDSPAKRNGSFASDQTAPTRVGSLCIADR